MEFPFRGFVNRLFRKEIKGLETFQSLFVNVFGNTSCLKPTVFKIELSCGNFSVGQWFESKKYTNKLVIVFFLFNNLFYFPPTFSF
jgi:hypothetical protein